MTMEIAMIVLFTALFGVGSIWFGIVVRVGTFKRWYLGPRVYPPQAIVYGTIPFGIAAIVLCIFIVSIPHPNPNPDASGLLVELAGLMSLFGFVLAVWRPKWIKPRWVRWLEGNYGDRIHILIAAARQNPRSWERRVATQEGLEAWAREVAGEPRPRSGTD